MRVREWHKNGSSIELKGLFGVRKSLEEWRAFQDAKDTPVEPEDSRPKVVGTSSNILSGSNRRYETSDDWVPIVNAKTEIKFGFQPNAPLEGNTDSGV